MNSNINCLMCIDYFNLIGLNELQICQNIKDVYLEASKTKESLIIINHLDTIFGIRNISNYILQTITTLIKYYDSVKTIATVSSNGFDIILGDYFDVSITL